jgi:hypothetical protein
MAGRGAPICGTAGKEGYCGVMRSHGSGRASTREAPGPQASRRSGSGVSSYLWSPSQNFHQIWPYLTGRPP